MKCRTYICATTIAGCLVSAAGAAFAQESAPPANSLADRAKVSASRQSRIRADTAKAVAELSAIIGEYERNGLGDEQDVKMLRAVRDTLHTQSSKGMEKVLAFLVEARNARSDDAAKTQTASAYAAQKDIYAEMLKTLFAFQQQTDLLDLSIQFAELAKRENANFKETKHLALKAMNARELDEGRAAELKVQQAEQDAIQVDVAARLDKLASLIKSADSATAAQLSTVTQQVTPTSLKQSLSTASSELRQGHLTRAASVELGSYRLLREFSRLARPAREPEAVLVDALDQITATVKGYQVAMADTAKARSVANAESRLSLDDEQGDLVDDVTDVSREIERYASQAYDTLIDTKAAMQAARGESTNGGKPQQLALQKLVAARQQIADELKRLQLLADMQQGDTKLARAEAIRDSLQELMQQEQQIKTETAAASTEDLAIGLSKRQAEISSSLQTISGSVDQELPNLLEPVTQASGESKTADDRLREDKPTDALDPEHRVIDLLSTSETKAKNAVDELQEETNALQQLQKMRDDLATVVSGEQALTVSTSIAAAHDQQTDVLPASTRPTTGPTADLLQIPPPTAKELAGDQTGLTQQTHSIQSNAPAEGYIAAAQLNEATQHMDLASGYLGRSTASSAQDPERAAVAALLKAMEELDKKIEELKKKVGQPQDSSANEIAQDEIKQAIEKDADAEKALTSRKTTSAVSQLQEADVHTANAQEQPTLPDLAKDELKAAHEDLGAAAGAAGGGASDGGSAAAHAASAEEHLRKALKAVEDAGGGGGGGGGDELGGSNGNPPPDIHAMHIDSNGERGTVNGKSKYGGLPERDRAAITQSSAEQAPAQYQPMIQQYMKNLADDSETPTADK